MKFAFLYLPISIDAARKETIIILIELQNWQLEISRIFNPFLAPSSRSRGLSKQTGARAVKTRAYAKRVLLREWTRTSAIDHLNSVWKIARVIRSRVLATHRKSNVEGVGRARRRAKWNLNGKLRRMNEGRFIKVWDHRQNQSSLPVYYIRDGWCSGFLLENGSRPLTAREIYLSRRNCRQPRSNLQKIAVKRDLILDFPWRAEIGRESAVLNPSESWGTTDRVSSKKKDRIINWNVYKLVICKNVQICVKWDEICVNLSFVRYVWNMCICCFRENRTYCIQAWNNR